MRILRIVPSCLLAAGTLGCATTSGTPPLIFGQAHIVGISIGAGTSGQAGDFTLGYKSYDLAVVPVIATSMDGTSTQIDSTSGNGSEVDALSVLGQFNVSAGNNKGASTTLGEFFSTGTAAQALAVGFGAHLCYSGKADGSQTTSAASQDSTSSATKTSTSTDETSTTQVANKQGNAPSSGSKNGDDCAGIFAQIVHNVAAPAPAPASSSSTSATDTNAKDGKAVNNSQPPTQAK